MNIMLEPREVTRFVERSLDKAGELYHLQSLYRNNVVDSSEVLDQSEAIYTLVRWEKLALDAKLDPFEEKTQEPLKEIVATAFEFIARLWDEIRTDLSPTC